MPESKNTFRFRVALQDSMPEVTRTLEVPDWYSFYDFHIAIQAAFGWEIAHLFKFSSHPQTIVNTIGIPDEDDEHEVRAAQDVQLMEIFKKKGDKYFYLYDYGDNWMHSIVVETVRRETSGNAICIAGENECPPEDIGGIPGYLEMLETFATGSETARNSYRRFLLMDKKEAWNPRYFSLRETHKRMILAGL